MGGYLYDLRPWDGSRLSFADLGPGMVRSPGRGPAVTLALLRQCGCDVITSPVISFDLLRIVDGGTVQTLVLNVMKY